MPLPEPQHGLVINYTYLWRHEALRGRDEWVKHRPCAIILAIAGRAGGCTVMVTPITHVPPSNPVEAIEIPVDTKRRLNLDGARSWIVLSDLNEFLWPGPDLAPISRHTPDRFAYGLLPRGFYLHIKASILALARQNQVGATNRDDT